MRKKNLSKFVAVVMSAIVISSFSVPVFAYTGTNSTKKVSTQSSLIVDKSGSEGESTLLPKETKKDIKSGKTEIQQDTGKISISLSNGAKGTSKAGVTMSCLKVADLVDGEYVIDDAYGDLGIDLNDIKNAKDLESAATKIAKVAGEGNLAETDENGKTDFKDLEVGVYLIRATDEAQYDTITPLLISIPTWSEKKGMVYELNVIPKHTAKPTPTPTNTPGTPGTPSNPSGEKGSPDTGLDSYMGWYFGGAGVLCVVLVVVNRVWKKTKKRA